MFMKKKKRKRRRYTGCCHCVFDLKVHAQLIFWDPLLLLLFYIFICSQHKVFFFYFQLWKPLFAKQNHKRKNVI
uniref:Uncharacterized protein n=1 Tax=Octopus bimaculoides TaxID=37653 RepID=A0A0L8FTZ5_OCTBM